MIELLNLEKSFDDIKAVNRVSLNILDGEVFGLVGTNGAGKSTLLRCICGVCKPDFGEILIDGESVWENPAVKDTVDTVKRGFAYAADKVTKLFEELTNKEDK